MSVYLKFMILMTHVEVRSGFPGFSSLRGSGRLFSQIRNKSPRIPDIPQENRSLDLLPIILSIAQAEGPPSVLGQIVRAILGDEHVALARIWFLDQDFGCPECGDTGEASALHLRASGGRPLDSTADWSRIDGVHHRVALDSPNMISRMVHTGEPVLLVDLSGTHDSPVNREWAEREQIVGFVGHPLRFRGGTVGVLAVFLRAHPNQSTLAWLNTFAAHAAVAIGNCRAFEQIDQLRHQLELERDYLLEEVVETGDYREIVGQGPALARVLQQIDLVAQTDSSVLIQGESGTGKELIARAIHQRSRRADKPLIRVNCGSIPHELFESEFFGHVKGAFTGAIRDRIGRFQLADGGTLFLDEVGEIPLDLQSKLLRVLQEGEFERVGDEHTRRVNIRLIAATNRDLRSESESGRFRHDLFYRLSVFPLELPALRERREDIPPLVAHFVAQACARQHLLQGKVPQREMDLLRDYDWPGNVRELQNVVERAVILAQGGPLHFDLRGGRRRQTSEPAEPAAGFCNDLEWRKKERQNLLNALRVAGGRVSGTGGAAELLGVNPNTLASRLRALGISRRHTA
jgi:transcriptional regulator with GAF, ATPase, and Fis domain